MALTTKYFALNVNNAVTQPVLSSAMSSALSFSRVVTSSGLSQLFPQSGGSYNNAVSYVSSLLAQDLGANSTASAYTLYTVPSGRTAKVIFNASGYISAWTAAATGSNTLSLLASIINSTNFSQIFSLTTSAASASGRMTYAQLSYSIFCSLQVYHNLSLILAARINNTNIYSSVLPVQAFNYTNSYLISGPTSAVGASYSASSIVVLNLSSSSAVTTQTFMSQSVSMSYVFPPSGVTSYFMGPGQSFVLEYSNVNSFNYNLYISNGFFWSLSANSGTSAFYFWMLSSGLSIMNYNDLRISTPVYPAWSHVDKLVTNFITIEESGS